MYFSRILFVLTSGQQAIEDFHNKFIFIKDILSFISVFVYFAVLKNDVL